MAKEGIVPMIHENWANKIDQLMIISERIVTIKLKTENYEISRYETTIIYGDFNEITRY